MAPWVGKLTAQGGGAAQQPAAVVSPVGAAVRSLLVPGLGQFYTQRPVLGALFVGAAGGAVAFGVLSKETTVRCASPLSNGECPDGQEHSRVSRMQYLVPGVGAAIGIAAVAAWEAYSAANRLNRGSGTGSRLGGTVLGRSRPIVGVSGNGLQLGIRVQP